MFTYEWPRDAEDELLRLKAEGFSFSQIASIMTEQRRSRFTRSMIAGKSQRLRLLGYVVKRQKPRPVKMSGVFDFSKIRAKEQRVMEIARQFARQEIDRQQLSEMLRAA